MSQRVSADKKQVMTPNMLGAIVLALAFFVLFALSGVSASTTLKETTVSTYMPLPQLFFSLSSASILLIPVALVCMVCALIALLGKQRNVAMMFSIVAFLAFGLFLFLFSREQMNSALYTPLSEALKDAGIKYECHVELYDASNSLLLSQGAEVGLMGDYSLDMPQKSLKFRAKSAYGAKTFEAKLALGTKIAAALFVVLSILLLVVK